MKVDESNKEVVTVVANASYLYMLSIESLYVISLTNTHTSWIPAEGEM